VIAPRRSRLVKPAAAVGPLMGRRCRRRGDRIRLRRDERLL